MTYRRMPVDPNRYYRPGSLTADGPVHANPDRRRLSEGQARDWTEAVAIATALYRAESYEEMLAGRNLTDSGRLRERWSRMLERDLVRQESRLAAVQADGESYPGQLAAFERICASLRDRRLPLP